MINTELLKKSLVKKGYTYSFFPTASEAAEYLIAQIKNFTVGIGGSKTVEELGIYERLCDNNTVFWHWKQLPSVALPKAATADIYLCSANAVSVTGEIVNIDGGGNRLSAITFGHKKVYIIVGINKVEETLDKAIWRARNIAAPLNAKRFGLTTPCAIRTGLHCYDCDSHNRLCKGLLILWRKMAGVNECEVIVINEDLGY